MYTRTPDEGHPAKRSDAQVYVESSPRWVRVEFNGETIADSMETLLLWDSRGIPLYYFPREDVNIEALQPSDKVANYPGVGKTTHWHVEVGDRLAEDAARAHPQAEGHPELADYLTFQWSAMDAWYEEDERIRAHPRDPYKRVDVVPSTRHIRVELDGVTLAESERPFLLFETGLPTRYYLPRQDVNMDLLRATDKHTHCPYKGQASYYTVELGDQIYENLVWTYPDPLPECPRIAGLISFYNEKVDLYIDGQLLGENKQPALA